MTHLGRRKMLGMSVASVATAALGSCVKPLAVDNVNASPTIPSSDTPVTLSWWSGMRGPQTVCDIFNTTQDRIRVEATSIPGPGDGGNAKLLSAVAAGAGPDIGQVELRDTNEFALAGALVDIGRYGAWAVESQIDPAAWSQVVVADSVYGIPHDTGPAAMFYQEPLFEALGAVPPASWEEWSELAQGVRDHDPTHYLSALNVSGGDLTMYAMQAGAVWFQAEPDGWIVNMTDDVSRGVAEFWDHAIANDLVTTTIPPWSTPWFAAAGEGRIYSHIEGSWADGLLKAVPNGHGKWRVAPMPRWDTGYASGQSGGSCGAVMAHSEHPAEALEFLTWMCTSQPGVDAMIEHLGIGWSPMAGYIGAERLEPSAFFGGQSYNEDVLVPMSNGQNLNWLWPPVCQRFMDILGDGMRSRVAGDTRLVDFLPRAQEQIIEIMRNMGLNVRAPR
ncbi:ABC transporter substrate-binding protein [Brachybacterium sacelli]|uniref:Multiple sugar transport system substrate-binding protein n=1 Tax=Brachybacterium sacelli TaxID=173364 RepID=A0ABS4WWA8_9MICO|nr:extracellular solute-binding protein [Brachybacterium sacelli]MBP2380497.1 multiple sugar transport system substrate-binding protein [Brachybacterium sacelli]